jgi:hypothetical protein
VTIAASDQALDQQQMINPKFHARLGEDENKSVGWHQFTQRTKVQASFLLKLIKAL